MKILSVVTNSLLATCLVSCSIDNQNNVTDELRLNDIQIIGSHNSYKRPLNTKVLDLITKHDANFAASINYSHPTLAKQLDLGLRHLEIDIVKDTTGGKFTTPQGEVLTGQSILTSQERELLKKPGFKVMHIPDLDFSSHCILFQGCLEQLTKFSEQQPNHLPIVVLMNLKESNTTLVNAAQVLPFTSNDYAELDDLLFNTFGKKLLTPDEIRGQSLSLEQAVLNKGWPSLNNMKGRFVFILDGKKHQLEDYRNNHNSLTGRAMFGSYPEGESEAGLMIRNNPVMQHNDIKDLVNKGYMVRTRADGGAGTNSKTEDVKTRTEHAFSSGAQIISTDFYPGASQVLPLGFAVSFKHGMLYRCNQKVRSEKCELDN